MKLIERILPHDYLDNPRSQISFHKRMMTFWATSAPIMAAIYILSFFVPLRYAILIVGFINFVTNQISFYANWATDFGALSAAQASLKADKVSVQVADHDDALSDLQDVVHANIIADF